jgi:hypothetical protein
MKNQATQIKTKKNISYSQINEKKKTEVIQIILGFEEERNSSKDNI